MLDSTIHTGQFQSRGLQPIAPSQKAEEARIGGKIMKHVLKKILLAIVAAAFAAVPAVVVAEPTPLTPPSGFFGR
jgi:hypothetical protein